MIKVKEFSINFDGEKTEYFAGETISGYVMLEFVDLTALVRVVLSAEGM